MTVERDMVAARAANELMGDNEFAASVVALLEAGRHEAWGEMIGAYLARRGVEVIPATALTSAYLAGAKHAMRLSGRQIDRAVADFTASSAHEKPAEPARSTTTLRYVWLSWRRRR